MKARIYFTNRTMGGHSFNHTYDQNGRITENVRACIHLSLDITIQELHELKSKGWTIDTLDDKIKELEQTLVRTAEAKWEAISTLPAPEQKGTNV